MGLKKKMLALGAGAVLSLSSLATSAATFSFFDNENTSGNPPVATVAPGDSFTATVYANGFPAMPDNAYGFQLKISWDNAYFSSSLSDVTLLVPGLDLNSYTESTSGSITTATLDLAVTGPFGPFTGFPESFTPLQIDFTVNSGIANGLYELSMFDAAYTDGLFDEYDATAVSGDVSVVPVPAAVWLFGSALLGLGAARRRR